MRCNEKDLHASESDTSLEITDRNFWYFLNLSLYFKIIVFTVILGACPCCLGTYWEIYTATAHYPHLAYNLMFLAAIIVGACIAAFMLPFLGRRRPLFYLMLPIYPAIILNALFQTHHWSDLAARALGGFSIGAYLTSAIIYLGEIALPRYRGRILALFTFGYWFGLVVYSLLYTVSPLISLAMLLFPLVCMILGSIYLPESPYFVMQIEQREYAAEVVYFLRCGSLKCKEREFLSIARYVSRYDQSYWSFLNRRSVLDRLWMTLLMMVFVHLSGFYVFIVCLEIARGILYEDFENIDGIWLDIVCILSTTLCAFLAFLIYFYSVDNAKCQRGCLMLLSSLGTFFVLCGMCAFFALVPDPMGGWKLALYVASPVYFFFYFLGQAFTPWLLLSEIFPHNLKPACCAFGICSYFVMMSFENFLVREIILAFGTFCACFYFALMNFFAVIFIAFGIPPYQHYSLEQVQEYFDAKHQPYRLKIDEDDFDAVRLHIKKHEKCKS